MTALLEHRQSLDSRFGCQWIDGRPAHILSWVFDLDDHFKAMVLRAKEDNDGLYRVSDTAPAAFTFPGPDLLPVHARFVNTLVVFGTRFTWAESAGPESCFRDRLPLADRSAARQRKQSVELNVLSQFCCALIANQDDIGARAKPTSHDSYCADKSLETLPTHLAQTYEKEA